MTINLRNTLTLLYALLQMTIVLLFIYELTVQNNIRNTNIPEKTIDRSMKKVRIKKDIATYALPWIFEGNDHHDSTPAFEPCDLKNEPTRTIQAKNSTQIQSKEKLLDEIKDLSEKLDVCMQKKNCQQNRSLQCNEQCRERVNSQIAEEKEHFKYNVNLYKERPFRKMYWREAKNSFINSIEVMKNSLSLLSNITALCFKEKNYCMSGQNMGGKKESISPGDFCQNKLESEMEKERIRCFKENEHFQLTLNSNLSKTINFLKRFDEVKDTKFCNTFLNSFKNKILAINDSLQHLEEDHELCKHEKSNLFDEIRECIKNFYGTENCQQLIQLELLFERAKCSKEKENITLISYLNAQTKNSELVTSFPYCTETNTLNTLLFQNSLMSKFVQINTICNEEKRFLFAEKEKCLAEKQNNYYPDKPFTHYIRNFGEVTSEEEKEQERYLTIMKNQWQEEKKVLLMNTLLQNDTNAPWVKEKLALLDTLFTTNYSLTIKQRDYELCSKEIALCLQKNHKSTEFLNIGLNRRLRRNKNNNNNVTSDSLSCNERIEQETKILRMQTANLQEQLVQEQKNYNYNCRLEKNELMKSLNLSINRILERNDLHWKCDSCYAKVTRLLQERIELHNKSAHNGSLNREMKENSTFIEDDNTFFMIITDRLNNSISHFYENYAASFNISQHNCKNQMQSLLTQEKTQCLQEIRGLKKYLEKDESFSWTQDIDEHIRLCEKQKVVHIIAINTLNESLSKLHHNYKLCIQNKAFLLSQIIICLSQKNKSQNYMGQNNRSSDFSANICHDFVQLETVVARQICFKETDRSIDLYVKKLNNSTTPKDGNSQLLSSCILELNSLKFRMITLNESFFLLNQKYHVCIKDEKEILLSERQNCQLKRGDLRDYLSNERITNDFCKQRVDLQIAKEREYFTTNLGFYEMKTQTSWPEEKNLLVISLQTLNNSLNNLTHEYEICLQEKLNCLREQKYLRPNLVSDKNSTHFKAYFDFCNERMKVEIVEERKKCFKEMDDLQKLVYSNTSSSKNYKRLDEIRDNNNNCQMLTDSLKSKIIALNNSYSSLNRDYELCYHQKIILLFEVNKCLSYVNNFSVVNICEDHIQSELLVEREKCLRDKQDLRHTANLNAQIDNSRSGSKGNLRKFPICNEKTYSLFSTLLALDNALSRLEQDHQLCHEEKRLLTVKKLTCLNNKSESKLMNTTHDICKEEIEQKYLTEKMQQWQQEKQNLLITSIEGGDLGRNLSWVKEKVSILGLLLTVNYTLATRKKDYALCKKENAFCIVEKNSQNCSYLNVSSVSLNNMCNETEKEHLKQSLHFCTKKNTELNETLKSVTESCCQEASKLSKEKSNLQNKLDLGLKNCNNDNLESCRQILHELNVSCIEMKTNCDVCYKNNLLLMNRTEMCYEFLVSMSGELNNCQNNCKSVTLEEVILRSQVLLETLENLFFINSHSNSKKLVRIRRNNGVSKDKCKHEIQTALAKENEKFLPEKVNNIDLNGNKNYSEIRNHKFWEDEKNLLLQRIQELNQSLSKVNVNYNKCSDEKTALILELNKLKN